MTRMTNKSKPQWGEGHSKTEAGTRVKPRTASNHQGPGERHGTGCPPWSSEGARLWWHLDFKLRAPTKKKNFLVPFFCRNTLSLHTLTELEVVWGLDPRQKDYLFRSQLCYQQSFCAQKHLTRPSLSQRVISSFGFSQAFYCTSMLGPCLSRHRRCRGSL